VRDSCKLVFQGSLGELCDEVCDEVERVHWGWSSSMQNNRDARLCWGYREAMWGTSLALRTSGRQELINYGLKSLKYSFPGLLF